MVFHNVTNTPSTLEVTIQQKVDKILLELYNNNHIKNIRNHKNHMKKFYFKKY